ncbi:hypothetical protein C0995_001974, partial [Termitomyces sp. Mi166
RDSAKNKAQTIAKGKSKEKEQEQELSAAADKQLAILLQCLHDARVLQEVDAGVLKNPVMQLAFTQVLNELNTMCQQKDEACADLFCQALEKEKRIAFPSQPLHKPKKSSSNRTLAISSKWT